VRDAGPSAAADGGVNQQASSRAGSCRASGGGLMTATHKFPMPTVSFHLTPSDLTSTLFRQILGCIARRGASDVFERPPGSGGDEERGSKQRRCL
jgi:hypothetical protein